jgi:hypothetical protein
MTHERKRRPGKGGADRLGGGDQQHNSENSAIGQVFAYSKEYALSPRYSVEFSLNAADGSFACYWTPHLPKGRKGRSLLPAYMAARHDFLSSLGINVLVIDL